MTKQRKTILEKAKETPLCWGYSEQGNREYYFADGTRVSQDSAKGLIELGLFKESNSLLGVSQELQLIES